MTKNDVVFVKPARVAENLSVAPKRYMNAMHMKQVTGMAKVSVMSNTMVMSKTPRVRTPLTSSIPIMSGWITKVSIARTTEIDNPAIAFGFSFISPPFCVEMILD